MRNAKTREAYEARYHVGTEGNEPRARTAMPDSAEDHGCCQFGSAIAERSRIFGPADIKFGTRHLFPARRLPAAAVMENSQHGSVDESSWPSPESVRGGGLSAGGSPLPAPPPSPARTEGDEEEGTERPSVASSITLTGPSHGDGRSVQTGGSDFVLEGTMFKEDSFRLAKPRKFNFAEVCVCFLLVCGAFVVALIVALWSSNKVRLNEVGIGRAGATRASSGRSGPPPTSSPTSVPTTGAPSAVPTSLPTPVNTSIPTQVPTSVPSYIPTYVPTPSPTTASPSAAPTDFNFYCCFVGDSCDACEMPTPEDDDAW